jgi:putative DeoR family transcriptional regulator (stage III sporulation protein D)
MKPFLIITTIHKDVTDRLVRINPSLAGEARKVLDRNKSERHIRGGMATREKYLHMEHKEIVS